MTKLLQLLSLLSLVIIELGTLIVPNNPMFWLASAPVTYQLVRLIVGSLLLVQFLTHPPRSIWFRLLSGMVAVATAGWSIGQTLGYHMQPLDLLVFLGAACTILETALERRDEELLATRDLTA